jgi:Raf kinase inhibitor-like YbhB/YbcL family protein
VRSTLGIAIVSGAILIGACSTTAQTPAPATATATVTATAAATATAQPPPTATGASGTRSPAATEVTAMTPTPFSLVSTAFADGAPIPTRFTCDGDDTSPDLTWSGAPDGTRSLALIVTDPDARRFVHWLVYDMTGAPSGGLPAAASSSPDAPPQGTNSFGRAGYGGPCPPAGTHHYEFVLYALDRPLGLSGVPRIADIQSAMNGHVIAETTLTGTYQR